VTADRLVVRPPPQPCEERITGTGDSAEALAGLKTVIAFVCASVSKVRD
jgi:hypothetical protein